MKSLELTALQQAFHNHLLNLPNGIVQEVIEGGRITVDHRLNIYHNAYRIRLLENLRDAFEKTEAYLGGEVFESAALDFIEANPPMHRNLRWHGADFPASLATRFPGDADIAELAHIDWQLRHAFDGPDAKPVLAKDLAGLSPSNLETLGFKFAPTLHLMSLRYNTVSIWHALDMEQVPPVAEMLPEPAWMLIWRKGWQPHFRVINTVEYTALSRLLQGIEFARVCEELSQKFSDMEAAAVAADSLRSWLQDELIVGLQQRSRSRG